MEAAGLNGSDEVRRGRKCHHVPSVDQSAGKRHQRLEVAGRGDNGEEHAQRAARFRVLLLALRQ